MVKILTYPTSVDNRFIKLSSVLKRIANLLPMATIGNNGQVHFIKDKIEGFFDEDGYIELLSNEFNEKTFNLLLKLAKAIKEEGVDLFCIDIVQGAPISTDAPCVTKRMERIMTAEGFCVNRYGSPQDVFITTARKKVA